MQSTPLLQSLTDTPYPGVVAADRIVSMGQIEVNCVLMRYWITWNRTVLTFTLHTHAKLNSKKWNCFCMLNWIVWNGTAFDIETLLTLNWIVWNRTVLIFNCVKTKTILMLNWIVWNRTIYLYKNGFSIK